MRPLQSRMLSIHAGAITFRSRWSPTRMLRVTWGTFLSPDVAYKLRRNFLRNQTLLDTIRYRRRRICQRKHLLIFVLLCAARSQHVTPTCRHEHPRYRVVPTSLRLMWIVPESRFYKRPTL